MSAAEFSNNLWLIPVLVSAAVLLGIGLVSWIIDRFLD
jgi:hypothetical protein